MLSKLNIFINFSLKYSEMLIRLSGFFLLVLFHERLITDNLVNGRLDTIDRAYLYNATFGFLLFSILIFCIYLIFERFNRVRESIIFCFLLCFSFFLAADIIFYETAQIFVDWSIIFENRGFITEAVKTVAYNWMGPFLFIVSIVSYYCLDFILTRVKGKKNCTRLLISVLIVFGFMSFKSVQYTQERFSGGNLQNIAIHFGRPIIGLWGYFVMDSSDSESNNYIFPETLLSKLDKAESSVIASSADVIVSVFLESFNQIYLNPEGLDPILKDYSIMPFVEDLILQSVYYDNYYSTAAHTLNGLAANLCGHLTLSANFLSYSQICLPKLLAYEGYHTSFLSSFVRLEAKHRAFFSRFGFHELLDTNDFRKTQKSSLDGFMYDKELFELTLDRLIKSSKRPSFTAVVTNQMHVPGFFDEASCGKNLPYLPLEKTNLPKSTRNMIRAAQCTDFYLKEFYSQLSDHFGDQLIFSLTGDHATNIVTESGLINDLSKMPLLILVPGAKPKKVERLGGTYDFSPNLLAALGVFNVKTKDELGLGMVTDGTHNREVLLAISNRNFVRAISQTGVFNYKYLEGITNFIYAAETRGFPPFQQKIILEAVNNIIKRENE